MAEFNYAKGRIAESLQFIGSELREFEQEYSNKTLEDYRSGAKLQKLIDRTVENILTALIETAGTILTQENIPVENYAQVLAECARLFGFSPDEQESFSKLALQRNRLAHRYLNFRWEAVSCFKGNKELIGRLLAKILARENA